MKQWSLGEDLCPFASYIPIIEAELDPSVGEGVLVRYFLNRLRELVMSFRTRKASARFVFHLGDKVDFIFNSLIRFDVVDFFIIADEIGLVNALIAGGRRLCERPESLLVMESSTWHSFNVSSALEYIEKHLYAPLSMHPTFYGFRLEEYSLLKNDDQRSYPVRMMWRKTPKYQNFGTASPASSLQPFLSRLAENCFHLEHADSGKEGGIGCTPLSYYYTVWGIEERLDRDHPPIPESFIPLNIRQSNVFNVVRHTFNEWRLKTKIQRALTNRDYATPNQVTITETYLWNFEAEVLTSSFVLSSPVLTTKLSLLLVQLDMDVDTSIDVQSYQRIDTFHISVIEDLPEGARYQVSFCVARKFIATECQVVLVDLPGPRLVRKLGPLSNWKSKVFNLLAPFYDDLPSSVVVNPTGPVMAGPKLFVENWLETEEDYEVVVKSSSDAELHGT